MERGGNGVPVDPRGHRDSRGNPPTSRRTDSRGNPPTSRRTDSRGNQTDPPVRRRESHGIPAAVGRRTKEEDRWIQVPLPPPHGAAGGEGSGGDDQGGGGGRAPPPVEVVHVRHPPGDPVRGAEVQVVLRRQRDPDARLRRGSLKSRFFQFKKRKKEPPDPDPQPAGRQHQALNPDPRDVGRQHAPNLGPQAIRNQDHPDPDPRHLRKKSEKESQPVSHIPTRRKDTPDPHSIHSGRRLPTDPIHTHDNDRHRASQSGRTTPSSSRSTPTGIPSPSTRIASSAYPRTASASTATALASCSRRGQPTLEIEHYEEEPYPRKEPVVSLRDPQPPPPPTPASCTPPPPPSVASRSTPPPSAALGTPPPPPPHSQSIPIYAQPIKKTKFKVEQDMSSRDAGPPVPPVRKHSVSRSMPGPEDQQQAMGSSYESGPHKTSQDGGGYQTVERPTGLFIPPHVVIDPSLASSCSIPSSPVSRDVEVILRSRRSPLGGQQDTTGRLLKSALARHFRNLHCGGSQQGSSSSEAHNVGTVLSIGLDHYIREIFQQLDYNHTGLVSREDFLVLCEVLELNPSPPASKRNSGIEWLSAYRPRPNSPGSPLRLDKLNQVKYKHHSGGGKPLVPATATPAAKEMPATSFLWTIGPRPFWELWPAKKRRKKQLTIDDFAKCLLEQWAKTYGYPMHLVGDENVFASLRDQIGFFETADSPDNSTATAATLLPQKAGSNGAGTITTNAAVISTADQTRSRRLIRSIVRVSRRYHVLERLSRRLQGDEVQTKGASDRNGGHGGRVNGRSVVNGGGGMMNESVNGNGHPGIAHGRESHSHRHGQSNGAGHHGQSNGAGGQRHPPAARMNGDRVPPTHHEELFLDPPVSRSKRFSAGKLRILETQSLQQKEQLNSLREVIEDLRNSLQLSDAQNLALQVSLRKITKVERRGRKEARNSMEESERQLENLVKELKKMSETEYPTMSSQLTSSLTPGLEEELEVVTSSLDHTVSTLTTASQGLNYAQQALGQTAQRLQGGHRAVRTPPLAEDRRNNGGDFDERRVERSKSVGFVEGGGTSGRGKGGGDPGSMLEAYSALQKAQEEIRQLRASLEVAQKSLEQSRKELDVSLQEYQRVQNQLKSSEDQLAQAENKALQLNQNRRSLLIELQSTKDVLMSSLNKVQDLEIQSQKVPVLQQRIQELERRISTRRYEQKNPGRPLSTIDSGLYSTDSTDSEQDHEKRQEGASDDDGYGPRDQGLPPRPPSARSRDKSPRSNTPSSAASERSPRSNTPSSGHHSAGSKVSGSSIQSQVRSPESGEGVREGVLPRLRKEIETLKKKFHQAEKDWLQERGTLIEELTRRRDDFGEISSDLQVLEAERFRLSLLEDKIKEVLNMLRTLNNMNISQKALGRLVLEAVEKSVDPLVGEIQVFKFLNSLYHSTREYERLAADRMLTDALEAVEGSDSSDSSDSLSNIPEGMDTIRPRRVRVQTPNQTFSIDV